MQSDTVKKRPLDPELQSNSNPENSILMSEPESKKIKVDPESQKSNLPPAVAPAQESIPESSPTANQNDSTLKTATNNPASSPLGKKRTLKVIPPKDPKSATSPQQTSKPNSPLKSASGAESTALKNGGPDIQITNVDQATTTLNETEKNKLAQEKQVKKAEPMSRKQETLAKMKFDIDREKVLALLEQLEKDQQKSIIVNDSRLLNSSHPNYNLSLGHVIYTGAKSRPGTFTNRASDLELFLCPQFSPKHYFATIQLRIPAEFLSYRGNIAVRKSALWGTDVYTDDSDVVAVIIHSGHYRPVDAPDPVSQNPDAPSIAQAKLVNDKSKHPSKSSVSVISPVQSVVTPVIAQVDSAHSSHNVLVPDHDLFVTLRVLPRLVKYSGSTRYGLDSKGWGSTHDGESFQVVHVETVPKNTVSQSARKKHLHCAEPVLKTSRNFVIDVLGNNT